MISLDQKCIKKLVTVSTITRMSFHHKGEQCTTNGTSLSTFLPTLNNCYELTMEQIGLSLQKRRMLTDWVDKLVNAPLDLSFIYK